MSHNESSTTAIDYYTDILCVWAWIAQPRLEELQRQRGGEIEVRHRYVDIFGDAHNKIAQRWGAEEGFAKFAAHVEHSAQPYSDTPVHKDIWTSVRPRSSQLAHALLKAANIVSGRVAAEDLALQIRRAFFVDGQDIGDLRLLLDLARQRGLDIPALESTMMNGEAMAALSTDQKNALDLGVRGSPTWVLNEGRQILYGNVGYRILNANIEELLKRPGPEASWC